MVLITIDSLRADACSVSGGTPGGTPNLQRWFEQGATSFDRAYTSGGWTSLAVSSMLRGYYPRRLRWTRLVETSTSRLLRPPLTGQLAADETARIQFGLPLEDPLRPLPWWLQRRGMLTAGVVDDGEGSLLAPEFVGDGFDLYRTVDALPPERRDDAGTADLALETLAAIPAGRPFFLWVHFFGPHSPVQVHPGVARGGDTLLDYYAHEVLYCDMQVGRLLEAVAGRQSDVPVAVVVAADHGELFQGWSRAHGVSVAEPALRVPLIVRAPPSRSVERCGQGGGGGGGGGSEGGSEGGGGEGRTRPRLLLARLALEC